MATLAKMSKPDTRILIALTSTSGYGIDLVRTSDFLPCDYVFSTDINLAAKETLEFGRLAHVRILENSGENLDHRIARRGARGVGLLRGLEILAARSRRRKRTGFAPHRNGTARAHSA